MSPVLKYPTNFCLDRESHERRTAQAADIQCYRYLTVKANIADKSFTIDFFLILTRTHSSRGLDENILLQDQRSRHLSRYVLNRIKSIDCHRCHTYDNHNTRQNNFPYKTTPPSSCPPIYQNNILDKAYIMLNWINADLKPVPYCIKAFKMMGREYNTI